MVLYFRPFILLWLITGFSINIQAQKKQNRPSKETLIEAQTQHVITWRRHLHQYPELSNREFKTMEYICKQLEIIGLPYKKGMAYTGVVATLATGKPGPVIGLRADMDGLPVKERVDLPFASKETSEYLGEQVPVMHACGHDAHVAILLGVAAVLNQMKEQLTGTIVFVFQPAEEGAPPGEEGGAELMIKQGLFKEYGMEVMFGLHISSMIETGRIHYKPKGIMAAADRFNITVKGRQTHGSRPWQGIDPITVSAQIILGLQNIVSRQTDLEKAPAVISIGKIEGGVRNNIIPEEVELIGTIRTLDTAMQSEIHKRIHHTAAHIAESAGAEAVVEIVRQYPVTYNHPELTTKMLKSLEKAAGSKNVLVMNPMMGAEDFSFYAREVPGLFFFLGARHPEIDALDATLHHTPDFKIDENSFPLGMSSLIQLVLDYQSDHKP
ncbi:MAG: amidohydrolase [Saprospiraceae bacterium]|nr:amidohydrolase [Saprospiraceae bacterium]